MSSSKFLEKQALEKERSEVLQQLEDWLETPMLVLGFGWLALFIVEIILGLNPLLEALSITIWIIFILDFLLKLAIAPHKLSCIKNNWLTVISLGLPALRTFRIIRFVKILRTARSVRGLQLLRVMTRTNRGMRVWQPVLAVEGSVMLWR